MNARAIRAFQSDKECRRFLRARPNTTLVGLASHQMQTPASQTLVLEAPLALAPLETDLLGLPSDKGLLGGERESPARRAPAHWSPHPADLRSGLRLGQGEAFPLFAGSDPEIAKAGLAMPDP